MTIDVEATIIPAEFPELSQLVWSRDSFRPIAAAEAFAIYERNWRFVDRNRLGPAEAFLIAELTETFGHGELLVAK